MRPGSEMGREERSMPTRVDSKDNLRKVSFVRVGPCQEGRCPRRLVLPSRGGAGFLPADVRGDDLVEVVDWLLAL